MRPWTYRTFFRRTRGALSSSLSRALSARERGGVDRGGVNGRESRFAARFRFAEANGGAKQCPLLDGGLKAYLLFGESLEQIRDHDDSLIRKLEMPSKFFPLMRRILADLEHLIFHDSRY